MELVSQSAQRPAVGALVNQAQQARAAAPIGADDLLARLTGEPPSSGLLSLQQAASFLGIAPGTLYIWRCKGTHKIAFTRVGKLIRYRLSDLEAFLESQRVAA